MTEIDPQSLTAADWEQIETTLVYLWLLWLSVIGMALSLLVAHAIIPSLATTGHVGPRVERVRPIFYFAAALAAAIAIFAFVGFLTESDVLRTIYTKVWI
ncbi:MAG: hypothetical protein F4X20_09155 [Dehalococcoidia bacterium]|nr:hypothetical protein [Dehalococcoidia bacterium]